MRVSMLYTTKKKEYHVVHATYKSDNMREQ